MKDGQQTGRGRAGEKATELSQADICNDFNLIRNSIVRQGTMTESFNSRRCLHTLFLIHSCVVTTWRGLNKSTDSDRCADTSLHFSNP